MGTAQPQLFFIVPGDETRETKVTQFYDWRLILLKWLLDHDVLKLNVAMDNSLGMHVV